MGDLDYIVHGQTDAPMRSQLWVRDYLSRDVTGKQFRSIIRSVHRRKGELEAEIALATWAPFGTYSR